METLKVPLIPFSCVVFPHQTVFLIFPDSDLVSLLYVEYLKGNLYAGVFLKKDDSNQREIVSSVSDVYGVGTLVKILDFQDQDEICTLLVQGIQRISLKGILPESSDGCPQSEPQPANHDICVYSFLSRNNSQGEESTASKSEVILTEKTPNSDEKFLMAQVEVLNETDAKPEELEASYQNIKKINNYIALIRGTEVPGNYPSASDQVSEEETWAIVDLKYMVDVTDLLGKEWTFDNSRPGKIIECLKETGTMNPVILLNGVDMVWRRQEYSICGALNYLLHWATKSSFQDSYLGFKVDLSKVLFVCIASDINSIPDYLHNNLPVIEVTGYFLHEKLEIAKKCFIPAVQLVIDDLAIEKLVREYYQELGVKHLKRMIKSIAVRQVHDGFMTVNKENVDSYLQEYKHHRVLEPKSVGVVRGLAYNHESSFALYIEARALSGGNDDKGSGHLDETFKESVDVAVSYLKNKIPALNKSCLHIDVPPRETPKYGKSAGIAIVMAIMSWCLGKPVPPNIAMTGEVTLHGTVQPVSGIRQKMIAAEKAGVTCIILPNGNKNDYEKLPEHIKKNWKFIFVDHCKDIFKELFPEHNKFWSTL